MRAKHSKFKQRNISRVCYYVAYTVASAIILIFIAIYVLISIGSHPQWWENPYLHLLSRKNGQAVGGDRMNPGIRILLLPSVNVLLGGLERVEVRETYCPWKLCGQRHEDVKRKLEYYHIIIFPKRIWNFTPRNEDKDTIMMEYFYEHSTWHVYLNLSI